MVNKSKELGYVDDKSIEIIVIGDFGGGFILVNCIFANVKSYKLTVRIVAP